jgi:short-subunit dehydrogenase
MCKGRGVEAVAEMCDLSQPEQISSAIQRLLARWDGVDLLINNAGIGYYGRTERMTAEQWNRLLAINLHAPIQITRELLPSLLARDEAHILNVCSILGLVAGKRMTAYQTSKFALVGFGKALRAEYVRRGLGVTALCPGFVRTGLFQAAEIGPSGLAAPSPPRWMLTTPEKVAAKALHAIRRNRAVVTVTPAAWLIWWIDRLMPAVVDFLQRTPWRKRRRNAQASHEPARILTNREE